MSRLRVHSFSISIDDFGVGPNQDLENPLGVGRAEMGTDPPAKFRTLTQPLPEGEEIRWSRWKSKGKPELIGSQNRQRKEGESRGIKE